MSNAAVAPSEAGFAHAARPQACAHPRPILAATILGSSLAFIDGSVVNVALPAIQHDLGADAANLSWVVNAYLLPLGALILLGGAAGDHFGRRRLFVLGLVLFALASLLCALAPGTGWLLAARGAQGIGAALLMPNSLAILGSAFSGEARGRAVGIWAASGALAAAGAPLLGGWLVDAFGWRTVFLINLPIAAVALVLARRYVPELRERGADATTKPLDWIGAALAAAALLLLTWALTDATHGAGQSPATMGAVAVGGLLLGGFVAFELRLGPRALVPLAEFASRTFVGLSLLTFFLYASLGGLLVLLPYLLIQHEHYSATAAGAAILPLPIAIGLLSPLAGRQAERHGGRWLLAGGAAVVALGFVLFGLHPSRPLAYMRDLLPALLLVAIGMAACAAPLTATVMASVDSRHVGAASGFNSAVARIAALVATASVGYVFALPPDALQGGFASAAWVGAGGALLASICAAVLIRPGQKPGAA